jgi:hypothetical protein
LGTGIEIAMHGSRYETSPGSVVDRDAPTGGGC